MSYRRPSLRRALTTSLALVVGPVAVLAPLSAGAVASPTKVDLVLTGPATALAFDDGRLLTATGVGAAHAVHVDTVTVPLVGQVTLAAGTATHPSVVASSPDRHTFATSAGLDVVANASTGRVLVRRGATTLLSVAAPAGATWSVDISGPFVRVGTRVHDVRRGATAVMTLPSAMRTSALYGSRVVWSETNGSVRVRDLATSAAPTVVRAGVAACTTCAQQVAINGDTVAYGRPGGSLGLYDLGARLGRPAALSLTGVERFRLGEGFVATTSALGISLHRLNDPLTLSVATPYLSGVHVVDLAFDGHAFAYVRADGSATVAQLPDAVDGERRPVVLASSTPLVFSPNGDRVADVWAASFVLTQRLTTWRLELVDPSTNSPVASFASAVGASPTANIAVAWKPPAARRAATYRWTLTGSGTDGAVRTAGGAAVTGSVTLRRANPQSTTINAPVDVATAGTSTRTPLSWKSAALPAGVAAASYDVEYRTVKIRKGKRVYGKATRVATRTAKRSTTFNAAKGSTTQFRARTRDSLGLVGPWSGWRVSNTPLDDRAVALRYGKGWKWKRPAGRWAGTERLATTSGRTVRLRPAASGFAVVMRTGPTCGAVKVYVDGKLRRTVDLASAAALRREVYSVNFKKRGKHTIKLVTVAKGKKKNVALDAIVVRH